MARKRARKKPPDVRRTFLLENKDPDEDRFWKGEIYGKELVTTWGLWEGTRQSGSKSFPTADAAVKELSKRANDRLKKGYVELLPHDPDPTQKALEDALAADPDDDGAHAAYADYLQEQGDPKGEYLQLQLLLEDEKLDSKQRKKFERGAKKLLEEHQGKWLGELLPVLRNPRLVTYELRRGWLDVLECIRLDQERAQLLVDSPQARLLRQIVIHDLELETGKNNRVDYLALQVLAGSTALANVRYFQIGWTDNVGFAFTEEEVLAVLQAMPRLEELVIHACEEMWIENLCKATFPESLRRLTLGGNFDPPLEKLAKNKSLQGLTRLEIPFEPVSLGEMMALQFSDLKAICRSAHLRNLTHFLYWRSEVGDKGIDELIKSGMLERLESLDLAYGCITTEGALRLVEAADPAKLQALDLSYNALDEEGVAKVLAKFPHAQLEYQHELDDVSWMFGDLEDLLEYDYDWE